MGSVDTAENWLQVGYDRALTRFSFNLSNCQSQQRSTESINGHSYSSVQANLVDPIKGYVLDLFSRIPKEDLYSPEHPNNAFAGQPHITVRYGLETNEPGPVRVALLGERPVTATIGQMNVFTCAKYDVLWLSINSSDMNRLYEKLGSIPHVETQSGYRPHLTVAYLKPGRGGQWARLSPNAKGVREMVPAYLGVKFDKLIFSNKQGKEWEIPLDSGRATESEASDLLKIGLVGAAGIAGIAAAGSIYNNKKLLNSARPNHPIDAMIHDRQVKLLNGSPYHRLVTEGAAAVDLCKEHENNLKKNGDHKTIEHHKNLMNIWQSDPGNSQLKNYHEAWAHKISGKPGKVDEFTNKAIEDHYDHMQKHLPDKMTLYRGLNWQDNSENKKLDEKILSAHLNGKTHIAINSRPVSGWSTDKSVADDFGAADHNGLTMKREVNKKDIVAGFGISPGFHQYPDEREYLVKADKINHENLGKSKIIVPIKDISTVHWGEGHEKFKTIDHWASSLSDKERNRIKNLNHNHLTESVTIAEIDPDCVHDLDNPLFDMFQAIRARDLDNMPTTYTSSANSPLLEGYDRGMENR